MILSIAQPPRYRALDAWRGVCALLVTFLHIPVAHGWQAAPAFFNLQLFVDFFFVLSGFVICHAYAHRLHDERDTIGFLIKRFGRVWPLHAAVLAAFVGLELLKLAASTVTNLPLDGTPFTHNHSWTTLVSNVVMTQAFNLHGMTSWNDPAWSIGVEFYTYAVFAAVVVVARTQLAFALMAVIGVWGVATYSEAWLFTTYNFGFFRGLYGFFVGCLVCGFVRSPRAAQVWGTGAELLSLIGLVGFLALTGPNVSSLAAPLIFAVIVIVFAAERGAISRLLLTTPAQTLGLWSFSIYMVHMLVFSLVKIALTLVAKLGNVGLTTPVLEPVKHWSFGTAGADAALVVVHLVLVLALARVTYRWIEDPARIWFGKLADGLPALPVTPAVGRGASRVRQLMLELVGSCSGVRRPL
jgi:peptidoglycan/LPS O-acetylase OafA/YrhL